MLLFTNILAITISSTTHNTPHKFHFLLQEPTSLSLRGPNHFRLALSHPNAFSWFHATQRLHVRSGLFGFNSLCGPSWVSQGAQMLNWKDWTC